LLSRAEWVCRTGEEELAAHRPAAAYSDSVLALDAMVDQDLFICPRCASPVRPEDGYGNAPTLPAGLLLEMADDVRA
jgi:hypothetical protein